MVQFKTRVAEVHIHFRKRINLFDTEFPEVERAMGRLGPNAHYT
jgi:hypothetical protein